jgi:hypothetical protein
MPREEFDELTEVDREFESVIPDELGDRTIETIDTENFMDEVSADLIKERSAQRAKEGEELDLAKIWSTLDRKTIETLQNTDLLTKDAVVAGDDTLYIDDIDHVPKDKRGKPIRDYKVPDHMKLWWVSPALRRRIGYRQWRPIRRTEKTEQWVPNARQFGSKKKIEAKGYVLMGMERNAWLRLKLSELRRVNTNALKEGSDQFKSAVMNARQRLGISRSQAKELDRSEASGFSVTKIADPDGPGDKVSAEDEDVFL